MAEKKVSEDVTLGEINNKLDKLIDLLTKSQKENEQMITDVIGKLELSTMMTQGGSGSVVNKTKPTQRSKSSDKKEKSKKSDFPKNTWVYFKQEFKNNKDSLVAQGIITDDIITKTIDKIKKETGKSKPSSSEVGNAIWKELNQATKDKLKDLFQTAKKTFDQSKATDLVQESDTPENSDEDS